MTLQRIVGAIALTVAGCVLAASAAAQPEGPARTLTIGQAEAGCDGAAVRVPVSVSSTAGMSTFAADIQFDPAKLNFADFVRAADGAEWAAVTAAEVSPGTVRIGGIRSDGPNKKSASELIVLTFECKKCPSGTVLTAANLANDLAGAEVREGTVTCADVPEVVVGDITGECTGPNNGMVTVPIVANGLETAKAFRLDLTFDTAKLEFVDVAKGAAIADWVAADGASLDNGDLRIGAYAGLGKALEGDGHELLEVTFVCAACPATAALAAINLENAIAGATAVNGEVRCVEAPADSDEPPQAAQ